MVSFLVLSPGVWARALPPAPTPQALGWWSRVVGGGPAGNRGATLASLAVSAVPGPEHLPQLDDCYDRVREAHRRCDDERDDRDDV